MTVYTTTAARALFNFQDFYRALALCEDSEVSREATLRANEAQRMILELADIENRLREMRNDYDKTSQQTYIPIYEVIDEEGNAESFPCRSLAEAYVKRQRDLGQTTWKIIPGRGPAYEAGFWDQRLIWDLEDQLLLDDSIGDEKRA